MNQSSDTFNANVCHLPIQNVLILRVGLVCYAYLFIFNSTENEKYLHPYRNTHREEVKANAAQDIDFGKCDHLH